MQVLTGLRSAQRLSADFPGKQRLCHKGDVTACSRAWVSERHAMREASCLSTQHPEDLEHTQS